uniref:Serpentine receptor class gamma n=1 Tax=Heterorhabditis bacteriophora TaxID=37862 RepID=A0A1I7XH91_HETBA
MNINRKAITQSHLPITWCSIALTVMLPFVTTFPLAINEAQFEYNSNMSGLIIKSDVEIEKIYLQLLIFMVVMTICTTAISLICIYLLHKKIKLIKKRAEKNMFYHSLCNFAILFLVTVFVVFLHQQSKDLQRSEINSQYLYEILPYISDLLTLSNPYLFVFLSKAVRTKLLRIFCLN